MTSNTRAALRTPAADRSIVKQPLAGIVEPDGEIARLMLNGGLRAIAISQLSPNWAAGGSHCPLTDVAT